MNTTIGSKLKALRKSQRKSQQVVADAVGITRSTLSNYEIDRRQPDLKTLRKLAEHFGVGLDYFDIVPADEVLDLLARAKEIFESDNISEERKNELFDAIMRLKLNMSHK